MSLQLVIPSPRHGLARCRCGCVPRHVAILGRGNTLGRIGDTTGHGVRHRIECSHCGRQTPEQPSLFQAESVWGRPNQQQPLPIKWRTAA